MHETLTIIKTKYPDFISFIFGEGLIAAIIFKKIQWLKTSILLQVKYRKMHAKRSLVVHTGRE